MPRFRMPVQDHNTEAGYLLASASVLILIVVALISSFAFVLTRTSHFQGNYATGERLANLAMMAHSFAQTQHYTNGATISNIDLLPLMNVPDNFAFAPVANTRFFIELKGADKAPLDPGTPDQLKAASAYMHLSVRTIDGKGRAPSDTVALQAGASHSGMARMGFYHSSIPAGDICSGETTAVRWGPEPSACLGESQASTMFADLQKGDIIAPVWEAALAQLNADAMVRYPQPERTDLNVMHTTLKMGGDFASGTPGYAIQNAADIRSKKIENKKFNMPATKTDGTVSEFVVTSGKETKLNGPTNINQPFTVYQQGGTGTVMNFEGPVTFDVGTMQVGNSVKGGLGGGTLLVHADNPVNVATLGSASKDMALNPQTGTPTMTLGVRDIPLPIQNLQIKSPTGRLGIAGNFNAQNAKMNSGTTPLNLYSARLTTTNTAKINNATNNLTWNVKSIEQKGTNSLKVDTLAIKDCLSTNHACPNDIGTGTPGGGF